MSVVHLWVAVFGRAAAVLVFALALGYPGVRGLPPLLRAPLAALTGFAVLSLATCLLGWARLFNRASVAILAVAAAAVTTTLLIRDVRAARGRRGPPNAALSGVIGAGGLILGLLAVASVLPTYPSTAFDTTSYHLPLARDLVDNRGLDYDPFVRYSFFPQANEAIFAVAFQLSRDPRVSAAVEFSILVCCAVLLLAWFVVARGRVAGGAVAALLVLASPVVVYAGTTGFVDVSTMTFLAAGLLVGVLAIEGRVASPDAGWALAGCLLGEAAATKYTGVAFGVSAVAGLALVGRRACVWTRLPLLACAAAVFAVPWYAWTMHVTGDPIYPLATRVFGNRAGLWTPRELLYQDTVARGLVGPGVAAILHRDLDYFLGRYPHEVGPGISPLNPLLALPLLGVVLRWLRRDPAFVAAMTAALLCVVVWVMATSDPRYFVPAVGFAAIAGGVCVDRLVGSFDRAAGSRMPRSLRGLVKAVALTAAAAVLLVPSARYAEGITAVGSPPTTAAAVDTYLASRMPCYEGLAYLNASLGPHYTVYGLGCERSHYYALGRFMGDEFGPASVFRVMEDDGLRLPDGTTLCARLQRLGVGYFMAPSLRIGDPRVLVASGRFTLLFQKDGTDVYRVND